MHAESLTRRITIWLLRQRVTFVRLFFVAYDLPPTRWCDGQKSDAWFDTIVLQHCRLQKSRKSFRSPSPAPRLVDSSSASAVGRRLSARPLPAVVCCSPSTNSSAGRYLRRRQSGWPEAEHCPRLSAAHLLVPLGHPDPGPTATTTDTSVRDQL